MSAALAYTEASQRWLYLDDRQIEAAVGEIARPGASARIVADVIADVSTARAQLASADGPVWWVVRPLAWRLEQLGGGIARVDVWTVTVLSATDIATPQSEYVTVTLDLVLVDGTWLVDAVRDAPGPTPITGPHDQPWEAGPFADALAGFTRVGEEAPRCSGFPNPVGWAFDKAADFVGGTVSAGFESIVGGLVAWVVDAVVWVVGGVFDFFLDATDPNVQADWFVSGSGPYRSTLAIGAGLLLLFVLLGIAQGTVAGDVGGMLRRVAFELPMSVVGMVGLVTITQVLVRLTDALSEQVLGNFRGDIETFGTVVASLTTLRGPEASAFVVFVLGLVTVLAGLVLVAELVVRSALIYIVVAFAPLVFSARLWPATKGASRKLLDLLVALVLSKLVIAIALAVAAAAAVGAGSGGAVTALPTPERFAENPGGSVAQAVGILLTAAAAFGVSAFSPLLIARLLPLTEAALVAQGVKGGPMRAGHQAMMMANTSQMVSGRRYSQIAQGKAGAAGQAASAGARCRGGRRSRWRRCRRRQRGGGPTGGRGSRCPDRHQGGTHGSSRGDRHSRGERQSPVRVGEGRRTPAPVRPRSGRATETTRRTRHGARRREVREGPMADDRTYRLEPLDSSGIFLGLGAVQCALLGLGITAGVLALTNGVPLPIAAMAPLAGAAASFTRIGGRPTWEWLPLLTGWFVDSDPPWAPLGRRAAAVAEPRRRALGCRRASTAWRSWGFRGGPEPRWERSGTTSDTR